MYRVSNVDQIESHGPKFCRPQINLRKDHTTFIQQNRRRKKASTTNKVSIIVYTSEKQDKRYKWNMDISNEMYKGCYYQISPKGKTLINLPLL